MAEKKRVHNKSTGRDYSYDKKYESSPEQKKRRAQRNKDRRNALKKGTVSKGDSKDVHHTDSKNLKNPKVISSSKNRAKK